MRFAIALHLRDFVDALAVGACLRVLAVDRLAVEVLDQRKHHAVAEVAVVRDRQHLAAGLGFVGFHPLPQLARVGAAGRAVGDEGLDLAGLVAVVTEDHIAMQVVALHQRSPLVADEGGELAGLVGFFRGLDDALPGRDVAGRARDVLDLLGELALREVRDEVHDGFVGLSPPASGRTSAWPWARPEAPACRP